MEAHIVTELGMAIQLAGEELHGTALVVPEMYVPETECARTSIIATWTDLLAGLLVGEVLAPRVPVTLELAVDLYTEPVGCGRLHAVGRILKAGRSVVVAGVDFTAEDDEPGVAVLARADDGLNASNTINGGLIALAVEEAALSRAPGATLSSLAMRYLRPARIGPVVATAARYGELARVQVRDAGNDDRLAVVATTRTFPTRE